MQIFLKTPSGPAGPPFLLDVEASDTIKSVKTKIQGLLGFDVSMIGVFFHGMELEDGRTLSDYNIQDINLGLQELEHGMTVSDCIIQDESTLHLLLRFRGGMTIFVKTLTERIIELNVHPSWTIKDVKKKLQDEFSSS